MAEYWFCHWYPEKPHLWNPDRLSISDFETDRATLADPRTGWRLVLNREDLLVGVNQRGTFLFEWRKEL